MTIDINQRKVAFGDGYKIFVEGVQTHTATVAPFQLSAVIKLFPLESGQPSVTIRKHWTWFKAKYDIEMSYAGYAFRTISSWKSHYQCIGNNEVYDIYGHTGRKYSIYQNNTQVAWWDKEMVSWFEGDNYRITANSDSNGELLMAFGLIIDNHTRANTGKNTITFDFGNIGSQAKKFDKAWMPK